MNFIKYISLFLLIVLVCCKCKQEDHHNSEHDKRNAELVRQLNTTDTFVREINSDESVEAWLRYTEKSCGLDSLNNGFDSIQIRIWYGCALGAERLIILSLVSNKWRAEVCERQFSGEYSSDGYNPITGKVKYVKPKSGWDSLITGLFNLGILTLPDLDQINGFVEESVADGCDIGIEIATKRIYREYRYSNPDFYVRQLWQAKNIVGIASLLNAEFGIKDDWPSYKAVKSEKKI